MRINVKEYRGYTLRQLRTLSNVEKTLHKGINHLQGHKWWISCGTAIGLYRDGDFIPNDTDLDVGITATKDTPFIEIADMKLLRTTHCGGRVTQIAYIDDNDCIFDLYYWYADIVPGKVFTRSQGGLISTSDFAVEELDTKYGRLPFPHPIEQYLVERYGETWQKPQPSKKGIYINDNVILA